MSLLLHAILPADALTAELTTVATELLVGVATACDDAPRTLGRADMLAHHALVARLHEANDACLPVRFPTHLADAEALRQLLLTREAALLAALERVRGRAELAVTVLWTSVPATEPIAETTPGRQYLLARQQAFQSADAQRATATAVAEEIERQVGPELVEAQRNVCPTAAVALSVALLVPRLAALSVAARIGTIEDRDGVRILVNGPWPPYTFVDADMKEG
jgi:hypothetical protein